MSPAAAPARGRGPRAPALAAGAALALVAAFSAGRWTGAPPAPAASPAAARPVAEQEADAAARGSSGAEHPPAATLIPADAATPARPDAASPPAQRTPVAPDVLARLRLDVGAALEARRQEDLARCWPAAGLPMGQASATLTYDLTFDAAGREVARGLSDDRRAPAGALGRCLSRNPGAPLAIPPQGTSVSLRVAATYP